MELRSSVGKEVLVEHIPLNCIFISDVCVIVFVFFNFSFIVYCVICCARIFLFVVRACIYHCVVF